MTEFESLHTALASLDEYRLLEDVEIQVATGTYAHDGPVNIDHPDGERISIVAAEDSSPVLRFDESSGVILAPGRRLGFIGGGLRIVHRGEEPGDFQPYTNGLEVQEGASAVFGGGLVIEGFGEAQIHVRGGILRYSGRRRPDGELPRELFLKCPPPKPDGTFFNRIGIYVINGGSGTLVRTHVQDCLFGFFASGSSAISTVDGPYITETSSSASYSTNNEHGFLADAGSALTLDRVHANYSDNYGFEATNGGTLIVKEWTCEFPGFNSCPPDRPGRDRGRDVRAWYGGIFRFAKEGLNDCGFWDTYAEARGEVYGCLPSAQAPTEERICRYKDGQARSELVRRRPLCAPQ